MRAFIAIELPQIIKTALAKLQEQLKQSGADVKWVEPQNIHLTLKFLGEINQEQLVLIKQIIDDTARDRKTFPASISSLRAFPKINFPRVIWAGISPGDNETKEIVRDLEEKIQKLGIPKEERPFAAHITLGRVRSLKNKEKLVQALNSLTPDLSAQPIEFPVLKITLFKSTLSPKGPSYEAIQEASLKPA